MSYEYLEIREEDAVATITMNRPKVANALSQAHLAEIEAAALSFRDRPEIRAVVIAGAGKHFSSGADLADRANAGVPLVQGRRNARIGERTIRAIQEMDQITVAAWTGAAMGGGACVALAADFRVGCATSMMSFPEIDIGLNLMWKSLPLVVQHLGPARAKRAVIGGEHLGAEILRDWGLLDGWAEPEDVDRRALELARFYADKAPVAAQMIKRSVNVIAGALDQAVMHMDTDQNLFAGRTEDAAEARTAYREGRPAQFSGE